MSKIKERNRTFDALLSERRYTVQGDLSEQKATVIMEVSHGHWRLKMVTYQTAKSPYSRSDWNFFQDLSTYVEYICEKLSKEKLELDAPKEINYPRPIDTSIITEDDMPF